MGTQDIWGFTGNTVYIRVSDLVYLRDNILRTLHEDYQMDNCFCLLSSKYFSLNLVKRCLRL